MSCLQHLRLQEKWKGEVGVSYAECGKSYKSSPTSSIVTFTEESDRITEIRSRLLNLDKNSWTDRLQIWIAKHILDSHTSVKVSGSPYRAMESGKVCGDQEKSIPIYSKLTVQPWWIKAYIVQRSSSRYYRARMIGWFSKVSLSWQPK